MNYQEAIEKLTSNGMFYIDLSLDRIKSALEKLGNPQDFLKYIHVAGTNGKGSCSHTLAAILQSAGYKVGLYTSPHLVDFRERIRVDGKMVSEEYVIRFVEEHRTFFEPLHPSFFELATAMAFNYFAESKVDVAIVEVGMGGRLDCTNIITPDLSIITNISFDHTQFLGDTLAKIASEKAGIIKEGVPVVIGECTDETRPVFIEQAKKASSPIILSDESSLVISSESNINNTRIYQTKPYKNLLGELGGLCQEKNTNTILTAIAQLNDLGYNLSEENVRKGFANVCELTGLMGRWQKLNNCPTLICDTGHNAHGIAHVADQLRQNASGGRLYCVMGFCEDKDFSKMLALMPSDAHYIFTQASIRRAASTEAIAEVASSLNLDFEVAPTVAEAVATAQKQLSEQDMLFIGGSTFVVAEFLEL